MTVGATDFNIYYAQSQVVLSSESVKHLGIDYGTKRIGVALSDEEGKLAFPHGVIPAGPKALSAVAELARANTAGKIVVGESRNYKNEPNAVMEDIELFKKDLEELTGLPVEYEAEFMTSAAALRHTQDKRGEKTSDALNLDASAAALILQSYLDRNRIQ